MNQRMSMALAWGGVLLAGVLWGGGALVAHWLIDRGISPHSLSLARFGLGLPLLWWWHWRTSDLERTGWSALTAREQWQVVGTGAAMALNVTCWFSGISLLGAALPTIISICGAPVVVAVVSVLRGYDRWGRRLLAGLALALLGTALVAWPAEGVGVMPAGYLAGIAWSFASALCYALVVLGNARMPARVPAVTASAWGMSVAALCMLAVSLPSGWTWPADAAQWAGVAYTGVVTTSVAYLAFAWGARRLSPTAAVVGTLIEPLVAAVLAAWLMDERLASRQWVGAGLLGAAMWLLARRRAADTR